MALNHSKARSKTYRQIVEKHELELAVKHDVYGFFLFLVTSIM